MKEDCMPYRIGPVFIVIMAVIALAIILVVVIRTERAQGQVSSCGGVSAVSACRPTFATVATLPTCAAAQQGIMYMVNDATTPAALATVVGGGAVHVGVTCNGSAWIVQ
jgi:hypothetical protein